MSHPGSPVAPGRGALRPPRAVEPARWQPTAAAVRAAVLTAGGAGVAVWARRPDLLLLVAPVLLTTLLALARPRPGEVTAVVTLAVDTVSEGATTDLVVEVHAPGADLLCVSSRLEGWLDAGAGRARAGWAGVPPATGTTVRLPVRARRWGRHPIAAPYVAALAADGLLRWPALTPGGPTLRALPQAEAFTGTDDVPRARGALGVHRAGRPGSGGELAGIREYRSGDRLRRVNWRVSGRAGGGRGDLYVNATDSERDAEVWLLVDARYDARGRDRSDLGSAGVDTAVRAAAVLARFYLQLGDRVGLTTHGVAVRHLRAGSGRGQLTRVLDVLLDVDTPATRSTEPRLAEPPHLDPRALVVLLSPLAGSTVHASAASLALRGHPVVVVDTLPPGVRPAEEEPLTDLALRLWLLHRVVRAQRLRELGVPVVPWRGAGSLDAVLRELARAGAGRR